MNRFTILVIAVIGICLMASYSKNQVNEEKEKPVAPKDAIATMVLEPGFQLELIAHEPLISSPVDMEIDELGRMYVVEMPGYPLDNSKTGRVKILYDTDKDGQFDRSEIFVDRLNFPNGIMRWKKGVIVTDAPHVLYFEDTNQDGKADLVDTLVTGFSLSNPHVNVNNPVYGLDNWIYLAHFGAIGTAKYQALFGDKGEAIRFPDQPNGPRLPVNANAKSVRFRPDQHQMEMTSTRSQFGHAFDPWGRRFLTHNQNHIYQEVIAASYLQRNPTLRVTDAGANISDHGNETEVFQITTNPDRQLFTPLGLTTSSSGIHFYNGGAFPEGFNNHSVLVCESVSNLVHLDKIEDNGAAFKAKRHRNGKEFLASKDSWFRPVNLYTGPDGAIYLIDYYRRIIEHPEWMSDEAVEAGGLTDGINMGRIYRISKKGSKKPEWIKGLTLGKLPSAALVRQLDNPNQWWRTHAQRLLVDRGDQAIVPLLSSKVAQGAAPLGRLHALWTLEGLNALTAEPVLRALKDPVPEIRENAIKLAEAKLAMNPTLTRALFTLQDDPSPRVRFQLLSTLGSVETPEAASIRKKILFANLDDEWFQIAALSAKTNQAHDLLTTVVKEIKPNQPSYYQLAKKLATMVASTGDMSQVETFIKENLYPDTRIPRELSSAILAGIEDGLRQNRPEITTRVQFQNILINAFFDQRLPSNRNSVINLLKVLVSDKTPIETQSIQNAMVVVSNKKEPVERRAEHLRFAMLGDLNPFQTVLQEMVKSDPGVNLKVLALSAMSKIKGTEVSDFILANWDNMTPQTQESAMETFLAEEGRIEKLLDAIANKKIPPTAVGWKQRVQLMSTHRDDLKKKARSLLARQPEQVIAKRYEGVLTKEGDSKEGKKIFLANCAMCHEVRGKEGVAFGPDLGTVHNWMARDLLANIVNPGLSVAQGFDLWEITLTNEEKIQGMIKGETSAAIQLKLAPGVDKTISRQEIKTVTALKMSMMPDFTDQIDADQMRNLIAYLKNSY